MIHILLIGLEDALPSTLLQDPRFEFTHLASLDEPVDGASERCSRWDAILAPANHEDLDGMLARRRAQRFASPIVVVTDAWEQVQCVESLEKGADEYLPTSTEAEVFAAKLEAVIRCSRSVPVLRFGDVSIDVAKRSVCRDGREVTLTPKEFDFIMVLSRAAGHPVPRTAILEQVWEYDGEPGTPVLEVLVSRLRRRLRTIDTDLIETSAHQGYRLLNGVPATH